MPRAIKSSRMMIDFCRAGENGFSRAIKKGRLPKTLNTRKREKAAAKIDMRLLYHGGLFF